jgi:2-methylisocitrate lyase-like PEP mutase family enzyme
MISVLAPTLPSASIRRLSTYVIAGADGLFIAHQIDGDDLDLISMFELRARALVDALARAATNRAMRAEVKLLDPTRA